MKASEKTELALIAAVVTTAVLFNRYLPPRIESGYLILVLGLLFLFQTLLRDLWLLFRQRSRSRDSMPVANCMCLEAGIGFVPVVASGILLWGGFSRVLNISVWAWTGAVAGVLLTGFWLKDYVIELRPLRIRKDPDHINFIFGRKQPK